MLTPLSLIKQQHKQYLFSWTINIARITLKIVLLFSQLCFLLYKDKSNYVYNIDEIEKALACQLVIDKPDLCRTITISETSPSSGSTTTTSKINYTGTIDLLVLVNSAVGNFAARSAIRDTWAAYLRTEHVPVYFLLASTNNTIYQSLIEQEDHTNQDILQLSHIIDSYRNLTLKSVAMLHLIASRCSHAKMVLKVDDDVLLNAPALLNFVRTTNCTGTFFGRLAHRWIPVLEPGQKNYCPQLVCYTGLTYPDFVIGPAYLFDSRLAEPILDYTIQHINSVIYIEDVYITGIVAQELNIPRYRLFHHEIFPPSNRCEFRLSVVWTTLHAVEIRNGWQAANTITEKCSGDITNLTDSYYDPLICSKGRDKFEKIVKY